MALILENGGGDGVVAGPTARAILDHIFIPQQATQCDPAKVDNPIDCEQPVPTPNSLGFSEH